jgi:general secretion pathway protein I
LCRSTELDERRPDAGFTMIEALVALAVVAVSLVAIGAVIAANTRTTQVVERRLSLVETGRAMLAALPDRGQLAPGNTRGELGSNDWRIDVLPFTADFFDPTLPTPWVPQVVVVRVESPAGEILRLDTVRLRRGEDNGQ